MTMATKRKAPEDHLKTGRPAVYKPEYCALLIEHSKKGGSFTSFGSVVGVARQTLYNWEAAYPEFLDAHKLAEVELHMFYEQMAKTMAAGQLRRLKSEKPMVGDDGKLMMDPRTGDVMYHREYEPATPAQAVFIFLTKNVLKWRDRTDIELTGKDGGPVNFSNLSTEQLKSEIDKLTKRAMKK